MKRRIWIGRATVIVGAALAGPLVWRVAHAQPQAGRNYRVGVLRLSRKPELPSDFALTAIPQSLRELGYVEGRNLAVLYRFAEGRTGRLAGLAQELVRERVDAIVAVGLSATQAAMATTTVIPIILFGNTDPVAVGLVSNLARPGGNLTGILIAPEGTLAIKRLELLKLVVPASSRIALLASDDPGFENQLQETLRAAGELGLALTSVVVRGGDYASAFDAIAAQRADALIVGSHQNFMRDRHHIIALASRHRLPAMYEWSEQVRDGGLMSYGANLFERYQRVALQINRVMNGVPAGELPIEQPSTLGLVINLRTARALGITIPPSVQLRADEVIQ